MVESGWLIYPMKNLEAHTTRGIWPPVANTTTMGWLIILTEE
jgi:hypothetical protein